MANALHFDSSWTLNRDQQFKPTRRWCKIQNSNATVSHSGPPPAAFNYAQRVGQTPKPEKKNKKKKKLQKQHKKLQGIYELHGRKHLRRPAACRAAKSDRRRRQRLSTANQKQKPKYKKKPNQTLDSKKGKPNVNETETKSETKPKSNDKCSHQGLRAVVLAKSSWPKPKSKHKVLNASGNHLKPSINQRKQ